MKALIAGGGTGGHLFPGVALAEELLTRSKGNDVLFVGTRRGIEARVLPELRLPLEFIDVQGLKGSGFFKLLKRTLRLPKSLWQSIVIVKKFSPDVTVGVGGYASGPVLLAAWLMGIPVVLLEQNSIPGVTNRIVGKFANAIFVNFAVAERFFPSGKVQVMGNPIRKQLLNNFLSSKAEKKEEVFHILVIGGSQGAHTLNLRMVEAAASLLAYDKKVWITHQTGTKDEQMVKDGYNELGMEADVRPFIDDVSLAYQQADLVICRSGATTLSEVAVAKKASILIPFPYAADNHQEHNAQSMVDAGASLMIKESELSGKGLAEQVISLMENKERRTQMEKAACEMGRPESAREVIDACVELVEELR